MDSRAETGQDLYLGSATAELAGCLSAFVARLLLLSRGATLGGVAPRATLFAAP